MGVQAQMADQTGRLARSPFGRVSMGAAVVGVACVAAVVTRSPFGALHVVLYLLATLPGWPIGRALFGHHPLGLIAGAIIGYGASMLAIWAVIASAHPSAIAFASVWAVMTAAIWAIAWRLPGAREPLVVVPAWRRGHTAALLSVLLLVSVLMAIPYRKIGQVDRDGNRLYRAYFTADFVWHMSLTSELAKFDMPPVDPYLGGQRMHYYWTYFLLPAAVVGSGPRELADPELVLKANALCTSLLFASAVFGLAWTAVRRTGPLLAGVLLTLVASSAEGAYALWQVATTGIPIGTVRGLNIDSLSSWVFQWLRIDGLLRSMWYNPQHSMAAALGVTALWVAALAGASARLGAVCLAGVALALATACNPFVGAVFACLYALVVVFDAARTPATLVRQVARHAMAAAPVALALVWVVANDMVEGAGGVLRIGYGGAASHHPVTGLLLSVGPVLLPALIALAPWRGWSRECWPAVLGPVVAVALMYLVSLSVDTFWVGFRAGQIFLVAIPALVARFVDRVDAPGVRRVVAVAAVLAIAAVGLPTTIIDTFNAQDTSNRAMGPGFRWTIPISPSQQAALQWIRRFTPPTAIVQTEPVVRGRDTWSLIPSFARRRMAAGVPLPLMAVPEYERRMREVQQVFATPDAGAAWREARRLGIDYLWIDQVERHAYAGPGIDKFDRAAEYFAPAFGNSEVRVYFVQR